MSPRIIHGEVVPERECVDLDRDESYLFHALTAPVAQEQAEARAVAEAFRVAARDRHQARALRRERFRTALPEVATYLVMAVVLALVVWGLR